MTAMGRDLPVAEHLSSVAMNVSEGGIAAGRDEPGATIFAPKALPGKHVEFTTPKFPREIMHFRAARNSQVSDILRDRNRE